MGAGAISVGDILGGKYEIESELGAGAMGLVFSARHLALNKLVAIKTLRAEIANDDELLGRFEQEARAASAIGHPNIVEVFDLGSAESGARYMVMEHLDGQSLAELLVVSPLLNPERAVRIMSQVLSALAAVHRCGIVHRDLKPDNIFITHNDENPELVKLVDFGIAKVLEIADPNIAGVDSAARATQLGSILGTPLYMSPEQARGLTDIDHRVDLWAVGCVLYEMMCGQPPFDGENYNQILMNILGTKPISPRQLRPATSPALEHVILRAMAHDRDQRYSTALTMREELHRSLSESAPKDFAPIPTPSPIKPQTIVVPPAGGSGALSAAQGSSPDADAAFASALDRLDANALLAGVTEPRPAPAATPAPAVSLAPGVAVAPGADRFAPPGSQKTPVSLDVAVDVQTPAPRKRATLEPEIARPAKRTSRAPFAQRSGGAGLVKLLFGLVLLGIIGGAAYMLYKQRAVVTGAKEKPVRAEINAGEEIEIYVDNGLLRDTSFEAKPGQRYVVELRAKGRLSKRVAIIGKKGLPAINVARLHLHYIALDRGTFPEKLGHTASYTKTEAPTWADLDRAFAALQLYHSCIGPVGSALRRSSDSYAGVKPRAIKRGRVKGIVAVSTEAVDLCRTQVNSARDKGGFTTLQELATPYVESVEELERLTRELAPYYNGPIYQKDKGKKGHKSHKRLKRLYATAARNQTRFAIAVRAHIIEWRGLEVAALKRVGPNAHWHLREVLRASLHWVWSELAVGGKAVRKKRADALVAARAALTVFQKKHPSALEKLQGANKLIKTFDAVVELAKPAGKGKSLDANQARDLHNRCVMSFNLMIL